MKQSESEIQKECVRWFRRNHSDISLVFFSVPNGGSRHYLEAARLKAEGIVAGVSDLLILIPNEYHNVLCIEMKAVASRGRQTEHQKAWQKAVEKHGAKYVICHSLEEFKEIVTDYLSTAKTVQHGRKTKDHFNLGAYAG